MGEEEKGEEEEEEEEEVATEAAVLVVFMLLFLVPFCVPVIYVVILAVWITLWCTTGTVMDLADEYAIIFYAPLLAVVCTVFGVGCWSTGLWYFLGDSVRKIFRTLHSLV